MSLRSKIPTVALFLGVSLATSAVGQTYGVGQWAISFAPGVQMASTTNASGSNAGVWCSTQTQTCFAFIQTVRPCQDGAKIPVLANSALGAFPLVSVCRKVTGTNGQPFEFNSVDLATFENIAEGGGEFAFAMPLVGDQFAVMRFSSEGAAAAIKQARTLPAGSTKHPADQVM